LNGKKEVEKEVKLADFYLLKKHAWHINKKQQQKGKKLYSFVW
jgi:hypothetical protein